MKNLFIGLGSIGARNLKSCLRVRPDHEYYALKNENSKPLPSEWKDSVRVLSQWDQVRELKPDLVWICNPTHLHTETLEHCSELNSAFFIEKPLSHQKEDLEKIASFFQNLERPFFYGTVLRHHPVFQRVKVKLESEKPLSYQIYCGSHLPDWRANQDYRSSYSASSDQGGGVHLDLIHEFDYAEAWFGEIESIQGVCSKLSSLEIYSPDHCLATVTHQSGTVGQIQLNYVRKEPRRNFEILFDGGKTLSGDFIENKLISSESKESFTTNRDELHDTQAKVIFECLENQTPSPWSANRCIELNRKVIQL